MSRGQIAIALAAAVLTLTIPLAPGVAHAERWSGDDASGDTEAWQIDPADTCGATAVTSDAASSHDIIELVARHQPGKLVIRLRYAAPTTTTTARMVWLHVRTGRSDFLVDVTQRRDGGRWWLSVSEEPEWSATGIDTDGDGVNDCDAWVGFSAGAECRDYDVEATDQAVTIGIPRNCLEFPRWVQVGASSYGHAGDVYFTDEWGTSEWSEDPRIITYGDRVPVSHGHSASPSNRSLKASSSTGTRRSFVISRTGFPIGTTAATAY